MEETAVIAGTDGTSQRYHRLTRLQRLAAMEPDRFYGLVTRWLGGRRLENVIAKLPGVEDGRDALRDSLLAAYQVMLHPLCGESEELRRIAIANAQKTLALVLEHQKVASSSEQLRVVAITDDLTGCYNQRYFREKLDGEITEARRYTRPLSLIVLDIDHFKKINDHKDLGHKGGDYVLRELAQTAGQIMLRPEEDTFARYGGEEFVFILPETNEAGAKTLAERVRAAIEGHKFNYNGSDVNVTISAGVAEYNPHDDADLFTVADRCLYAAKALGRNRVISVADMGQIVCNPRIGKDALMKMLDLTYSWFEYFSRNPLPATLKTAESHINGGQNK